MAEQVKGVSIATTTVQQLKAEIKGLKDEISALILTDSDYQQQAEELTQKQLQLSKATEVTKGAVIGVTGSYAQLVAETNKLRKEWRSVEMGSERFQELSAQINANNNRLKEMDKTIGDNFRNVGNYSGGIIEAFDKLGGTFPSVQKGIMGVKTGFQALSATPVIGTISLIIQLIMRVVATMKQSEEGTKALTAVMGVFDSVMVVVTKGLEFLGKGIGWVIEKVTELTAKWFGQNKVVSDNIKIQQDQIALEQLHRDNLVKSAKLENEISELRAKASDKIKYSAKERIEFLEKAIKKELELQRMAQEEAQKEYELIKLKNEQTQSGTKDLEAEAQAQAKVIRTQTEYNKKIREYNAQLTEAKRQAGLKLKADAVPLSVEVEAKVKVMPTDIDFSDVREETEKELAEVPLKANEALRKGLEQETAERLRYAELAVGTEEQKAQNIYNIQQQALINEMTLLQQGLDNAIFVGEERIKAEERVAQIQRDIAYNTAEYQQKVDDAQTAKKVANQKTATSVAIASANAIGSILGSVADMYEQEGEANEEATKKAKNLRIAGATMDMLGGLVSAWTSALNPANAGLTIWGQIAMATLTSATILASGIANIQKIRNTDTSGNSSGVSASVSAPSIVQQVPVTRTLTGVAEEERLNQAQRVYVVYDDIAQVGRKVDVTESEATF